MNFKKITALAILLIPSLCQGTVSAMSKVVIPYQEIQSGDLCLLEFPMIAEYGIPLASLAEGIFSETKVLQQVLGGNSFYVNINQLSLTANIAWQLIGDSYNNGVWTYEFNLDFSQISYANGSSVSGRQSTVDTIKLALISLTETARRTHGNGNFKLILNLNSVPSQIALQGSVVYTQTQYPYTSGSPLIANYKNELLGSNCN